MAGSAKPSISNLGIEATYTINSYYSSATNTASYLFDENVGTVNTIYAFFWYASSDYLDITINSDFNLYGIDYQDSNSIYNNQLVVKKWNGNSFENYTTTIQTVSPYNSWQKILSRIPKGRYRFEYNNAKCIFTEWYIEVTNINRCLIKQNSNYYSIMASNYDSVTTHTFTPLSLNGGAIPNKNDIEVFGFDDLNALTNNMTVGNDTFRPIDKLGNNFDIKIYKE